MTDRINDPGTRDLYNAAHDLAIERTFVERGGFMDADPLDASLALDSMASAVRRRKGRNSRPLTEAIYKAAASDVDADSPFTLDDVMIEVL